MLTTQRSQYQTPRPAPAGSSPKNPERKRLRDWAAEDACQVGRGRIDLYIHPDAFSRPGRSGRRGAPRSYSDELVWAAQVMRKLERRAYRPLEGYVRGLAKLMGYRGPTPDHVTLWRRAAKLPLPPLPRVRGRRRIVIDSTGVSVYGAGQWRSLRWREHVEREYLKLHCVRDADTGEILDWALTRSDQHGSGDGAAGAQMLDQLVSEGLEISVAYGDGAYDAKHFRQAVWRAGGQAIIPPPRNARLSTARNRNIERADWELERDDQILACRHDRDGWKRDSGYHTRSTIETTMSRLVTLFGDKLHTSNPQRQRLDIATRIWLLNQHALRSTA